MELELAWIQNYLTNRYQNVILEGICSSNSPVTSGVPQGTMIAPLLFSCFVNDIQGTVKDLPRHSGKIEEPSQAIKEDQRIFPDIQGRLKDLPRQSKKIEGASQTFRED